MQLQVKLYRGVGKVPKVTVLMPVYNTREEFLRETMDAVLKQTFTDFEFLIINDASTDPKVAEVVKSYNDPRIVYVENKHNLGISESSNLGISLAKGKYIARQDHDDISEPERLAEQVKVLDEHPEIGVCGSFFRVFPKKQKVKLPQNDREIKVRTVLHGAALCHPAAMIRKKVLTDKNIRYEDAYRFAEDYQLWIDLINETEFYNIPRYLFNYRWFGGNASITANDVQAVSAFKARVNAVTKILPDITPSELELFARLYKKERLTAAEFRNLYECLNKGWDEYSRDSWQREVIHCWLVRLAKQSRISGKELRLVLKSGSLKLTFWDRLKLWKF